MTLINGNTYNNSDAHNNNCSGSSNGTEFVTDMIIELNNTNGNATMKPRSGTLPPSNRGRP